MTDFFVDLKVILKDVKKKEVSLLNINNVSNVVMQMAAFRVKFPRWLEISLSPIHYIKLRVKWQVFSKRNAVSNKL